MATLVIRHLSFELHQALKEEASRHHRSMTQQAITILERSLREIPDVPKIKPFAGAFPLDDNFINTAKRCGRA